MSALSLGINCHEQQSFAMLGMSALGKLLYSASPIQCLDVDAKEFSLEPKMDAINR